MMNKTYTSLPGSRSIGNYIIGKNLGQGTFGKVKMGIHSQTQQKVAIKILQKSKISDVADVQRVTRQINILKQVRHPGIIQLYEIIQTPKQLFLVMEYVSQGELFEYIVKKKKLKQQQACIFFQQIIVGVQYLHELGVVHRDLKPQNLLIDFNKRIKLVDFGLSNIYKPKQLLKTACGSPCYAAPEMIAGKKYQGLNADIWSCGVILYAMICGYLPFQDPNTSALYKKIIAGDFHIPKFVSPLARDLIQGILTTDPYRRYSIRTIKNHQWFRHYQNGQFYVPQKIPFGIKVSAYMIPIDEEVLQQMKQIQQINEDQLRRYIANNRHNHLVSVYYLLLKKNLRLGKHSQSDICSSKFNPSILQIRAQDKQRIKQTREDSKRSDSLQLDRTTTASGNRTTTRAINRIHFIRETRETRNNNFLSKKKQDSVELKLDLDNLPVVDNNAATHRRRKLNIKHQKTKNKKDQITNFYDIEESFRATNYPVSFNKRNKPSISNRVPISFRNTIDVRQTSSRQNDRYSSLQVPQSVNREKNIMNQTFMGKIPKPSIPKWQDESQKIRSILNKTITGHGTRKRKNNKFTVLM